jgi:hypothetical protein
MASDWSACNHHVCTVGDDEAPCHVVCHFTKDMAFSARRPVGLGEGLHQLTSHTRAIGKVWIDFCLIRFQQPSVTFPRGISTVPAPRSLTLPGFDGFGRMQRVRCMCKRTWKLTSRKQSAACVSFTRVKGQKHCSGFDAFGGMHRVTCMWRRTRKLTSRKQSVACVSSTRAKGQSWYPPGKWWMQLR